MQRSKWLASIAVVALLASAPAALQVPFGVSAAQAQEAGVSFSVFFGELRPHGVWVRHTRYNYVWCPRVDARWRPYTNGRWLYVRDRGWYFDSDEPFAWAVYHYGRWHEDADLGWCWVPGRHWAPAWVSWRRSNDYVGWAPLRPEEDGYSIRFEVNIGEPAQDDWVFVPVRSFIEPRLSVNIVFGDENPEVFSQTEYLGPVIIQNNVVINNNIDITFIEQQTNTEVAVVELATAPDLASAKTDETGGTIEVFAPVLEEPVADEVPEAAVEPEQAKAELAEPAAEGEASAGGDAAVEATTPAADADAGASTDATTTEAPADAASDPAAEPAADPNAPVTECPEGQQLVDGACVPIAADAAAELEAAAPAAETAPANEAEVPAEPAAPVEEEAAPAPDAAAPSAPDETEEAAPVEEEPAPAPAEGAAPEELACEEGFLPFEGKCVPADEVPADAAPAQ